MTVDADRFKDATKQVFANEGDGELKPVIVGFVEDAPFSAIQIMLLGAIHTEAFPIVFDNMSEFDSTVVIEFTTITTGDALKLLVVPFASV